jgi:hypothetical protein
VVQAATVFRSIRARTRDPFQEPGSAQRRLSQGSQLSSSLELTTDLGPISDGWTQLEIDLELMSGSILRVRRTVHVLQGHTSEGSELADDAVFDMSQTTGADGTQGEPQGNIEPEEPSKGKPGKLRMQRLVFLIVGPLMLVPVVAGLLLLLARFNRKQLNCGNKEEQQDTNNQAGINRIAPQESSGRPTVCSTSILTLSYTANIWRLWRVCRGAYKNLRCVGSQATQRCRFD